VASRGIVAAVRRHPLAAYWAFAFALSWAYWIPLVVTAGQRSHFPGLLGPMVAGVLVTGMLGGWPGLRALAAAAVRWRVAARWYLLALAPLPAGLLGVAVVALAGSGWPSGAALSAMPGLPEVGWLGVFLLALVVNGYGEEVGWRGVAWPLLRRRHGVAGAALLLTGPWALWHLPTFWIATGLADFDRLLIPGWLLGLAAGSVVLGWLYERTGGSLLLAALFHAGLNMASATQATAGPPAIITSALVIVAAVAVLRAVRHRGVDGSVEVRFDAQVRVRCSPQDAFDVLANVDRYATHPGSPVAAMERIPPGPTTVGTRWREVIRLGPFGHFTVWSEVTALAEPYELVEHFAGPGMRGTLRYALEPLSPGLIILHQHQRFWITGRLASARRRLIERMWVPRATARMEDLRRLMEASVPAGADVRQGRSQALA
jgi:uncharacterized protein